MTALWLVAFIIAILIAYRTGMQDGKRLGATAVEPPLLAAQRAQELQAAEVEVAALLGEPPTAARLHLLHPRLTPVQVLAIQQLLLGDWAPHRIRDLCLYELRAPGDRWSAAIVGWVGDWDEGSGRKHKRGK
jgi:hypothetical protein